MTASRWLRGRNVVLALTALVTWSSVWIVGQDEQGVVTRLGAVRRVVTSGINLTMPWPIEWMNRVSTTEVRTTSIGISASGFAPSEDDVQWMTGDTNIFEMKVAVQYVVGDAAAYLYSVADFSDGRSRDELIQLAARAELTQLVARMRIDDVLSTGKAELQSEARVGVQALLERLGLGVRVLAVNIVEARPPAKVIAEFNDVASAESDRERMMSEADGFRRDLLPKEASKANQLEQDARIYKDEVINRARGAASRFNAIAAEMQPHPALARQRYWLDAVSRVLSAGKTIVYASKRGEDFVLRIVK